MKERRVAVTIEVSLRWSTASLPCSGPHGDSTFLGNYEEESDRTEFAFLTNHSDSRVKYGSQEKNEGRGARLDDIELDSPKHSEGSNKGTSNEDVQK